MTEFSFLNGLSIKGFWN